MGKKKAAVQYATVDLDTGKIACLACGAVYDFLPPGTVAPEAGPNSFNHTGCPAATAESSPAGPNIDGLFETINPVNRADVDEVYKRRQKAAKA